MKNILPYSVKRTLLETRQSTRKILVPVFYGIGHVLSFFSLLYGFGIFLRKALTFRTQ